eukprot:scpid82235/ scgid16536/ 
MAALIGARDAANLCSALLCWSVAAWRATSPCMYYRAMSYSMLHMGYTACGLELTVTMFTHGTALRSAMVRQAVLRIQRRACRSQNGTSSMNLLIKSSALSGSSIGTICPHPRTTAWWRLRTVFT